MKGRYGHVAAAMLNDTLFITAGYRGSVLGDLWSLKLPLSITGMIVVSVIWLSSSVWLSVILFTCMTR